MKPIGKIRPETPFLLAPLAGITDTSFRRLCKEYGASVVYTEMVSGKGIYYNDKKTESLLKICDDEAPAAIQIFGSEPHIFAFAARELENRPNLILDINMGCPVPKIVKNGEGSALMKNPDLAGRLVEAAVANTKKPVTVKMRMGWSQTNINAVEIAKIVEAAGAAAVAVHGRTRDQYYSGTADWDIIGAVKAAVNIPVIGNGDIFSPDEAVEIMKQTGCDYVMIARGALGYPQIFRDATSLWRGDGYNKPPSPEENLALLVRHLDMLEKDKGSRVAVMQIRKHVGWYLKGFPGIRDIRSKVHRISDIEQLRSLLLGLNPIQY